MKINYTHIGVCFTLCATAFIGGRASIQATTQTESSNLMGNSSRNHASPRTLAAQLSRQRPTHKRSNVITTSSQADENLVRMFGIADPLQRNETWIRFVKSLKHDEFPSIIAAFHSKRLLSSHQTEYGLLISKWTNIDPLGAISYLQENHPSHHSRAAAITTWAQSDPYAALAWAKQFKEQGGAEDYRRHIIRGLALSNPQLATQFCAEIQEAGERQMAMMELFPSIQINGTKAVDEWVSQLPAGEFREEAIHRAAANMSIDDAAAAAKWLERYPGEGAINALPQIMSQWARQDLEGAADYISELTSPELKSEALRSVLYHMISKHDLQDSERLLQRFSNQVDDQAYEGFIIFNAADRPDIGVKYISQILRSIWRWWWIG